ncbi:MAG: malto-oligosyltrehalose trehalohydrolase [Acetobacteraceae bacterium]|nr:malto-oligosyltrehalose trehalohydrolase [Acetobacteraceae bacterium]
MTTQHLHRFPFGAQRGEDGRVTFRLWAPDAPEVALEIEGRSPVPMEGEPEGWFAVTVPAEPGAQYKYRVKPDLAVPDPASRFQAGDVHGASVVVDPRAFSWKNTAWRGRPWNEAVIYELHPGATGGFAGITAKLPALKELGVTVVELMPIADFPGRHNWGYDGVLPYAPDSAYGTPDELKTLIDTAHGLGVSVMLDVVYNHFGPDGNYLHAYAETFFRDDLQTPWGVSIDFRKRPVRDYFIGNALYWLMEYRFDGLRFDAVHAISEPDFLDEMARTIRATVEPGRHVHLVLEHEGNKASHLAPGLFDAQWTDDWHHCMHVMLTGEHEGYYEDFQDSARQLARAMAEGFVYQGEVSPHGGEKRGEPSGHLPPTAFVICLQNHDQIGNRAFGDRLTALARPAALRAAATALLMSPNIPMLFMGEEWGTKAPFLFFTDHNEELAKLVREGRRREFQKFAAFSDPARRETIPDPNAASTFDASTPDASEATADGHAAVLSLHRELLALRHRYVVPGIPGARSEGAEAIGPKAVVARWRLGNGALLTIAVNLDEAPVPIGPLTGEMLYGSGDHLTRIVPEGALPGDNAVVFITAPGQ